MIAKTYTLREAEIERRWYVVDATDETLGRLASRIARVLEGKPHGGDAAPAVLVDVGDAEGVGGRAVAGDLAQDLRPALHGVLVLFEDKHARALAEHEPVAGAIERAAGACT